MITTMGLAFPFVKQKSMFLKIWNRVCHEFLSETYSVLYRALKMIFFPKKDNTIQPSTIFGKNLRFRYLTEFENTSWTYIEMFKITQKTEFTLIRALRKMPIFHRISTLGNQLKFRYFVVRLISIFQLDIKDSDTCFFIHVFSP